MQRKFSFSGLMPQMIHAGNLKIFRAGERLYGEKKTIKISFRLIRSIELTFENWHICPRFLDDVKIMIRTIRLKPKNDLKRWL